MANEGMDINGNITLSVRAPTDVPEADEEGGAVTLVRIRRTGPIVISDGGEKKVGKEEKRQFPVPDASPIGDLTLSEQEDDAVLIDTVDSYNEDGNPKSWAVLVEEKEKACVHTHDHVSKHSITRAVKG